MGALEQMAFCDVNGLENELPVLLRS